MNPEITPPPGAVFARNKPGCMMLYEMLSDIEGVMASENYDDEFLKPAEVAYNTAKELLRESNAYVNGFYPLGDVYPDGEGGIRVEWEDSGRHVRLIAPAREGFSPYIYHESHEDFDSDYSVTPAMLGKWLNWLNGHAERTNGMAPSGR